MRDLAELLPELEAQLGPLQAEPVELTAGITNRNLRLRLGDGEYVVRLCEPGATVLGIDRGCEAEAGRRAAGLGIGPEVVLAPEGALVTRWLGGGTLEAEQVRERLGEIAPLLRAFHASTPPLPFAFAVFRLAEAHARIAAARLPPGHARIATLAQRIEAALSGHPEHAPRPCHNDLLTANFVCGAGRVHLVDWEYSGMNDPFFDLGNLSVNNGLDDAGDRALLEAYFGEPPGERRLAALALMRIVSDLREALWGAVQATISPLDADYDAYAAEHFARLEAAADDPRVEAWLHAASA
jgi:thiamine kinase-like enzyme